MTPDAPPATLPELPPLPDPIVIDEWKPDYKRRCEVCGQKPVVTGVTGGKVVYQGTMCGVCSWGEAACLDPEEWNR